MWYIYIYIYIYMFGLNDKPDVILNFVLSGQHKLWDNISVFFLRVDDSDTICCSLITIIKYKHTL